MFACVWPASEKEAEGNLGNAEIRRPGVRPPLSLSLSLLLVGPNQE